MAATHHRSRLTNFVLEPIVPEICASALTPALSHPMGEGADAATPHPGPLLERGGEGEAAVGAGEREFYEVTLTTCSNQFLIGTQQVAWLHFTAISNQSSAFVPLILDNTVGQQPDGTEVRNFAPQAGRVVVVGEEPLLESTRTTNGLVQLILYSKTGVTNRVQSTPSLPVPGAWTTWEHVVPSNILQNLTLLPPTNRVMIFRAVRP